MNEDANLQWIAYFSGDRARLNERPLFLTCYLGSCAFAQTFIHYRNDVDRLVLGLSKKEETTPRDPLKVVMQHLPGLFISSVTGSIISIPVSLFFYYAILRSFTWGWTLMFLRVFYNLPKTNMLPPSWPTDIWVLARCVQAGTLIFFIWNAGNFAFSSFMVKEPLKNGKPLTSESKDPNGSLLNGLKSKKLSVKVSSPNTAERLMLTLFRRLLCGNLRLLHKTFLLDDKPSTRISTARMARCGRRFMLSV